MRISSLLTSLVAIKDVRAQALEIREGDVVIDVKPTWRTPRCSACGGMVRQGYDSRVREWRHLELAGVRLKLRARIRRVSCRKCGVVVEQVPWAAPGSWFTYDFENEVAYHAQRTDRTTVTQMLGIAWRTVGDIVVRVVARVGTKDKLDGLRCIGVDELSYRRHHEYVTVVVDHDRGCIVWAGRGKSAATLTSFFEELGPNRTKQLEAVTIDMSQAYIRAVTEASPNAVIIFDRFHVQRLAHDAVDEVRRDEVRSAEKPKAKKLKGTRWALLKGQWNLTDADQKKLRDLEHSNRRLFRAYLLKEGLVAVLDSVNDDEAHAALRAWLAKAARSRLKPFVRLASTLQRHFDGIIAYVRSGLSNGRTEGLNGKARVITKRAFGFHSARALISMLFLCCGGLTLSPVRKSPLAPTKPS